ncbi:MAG: carbohydrate ABC transporter permease [Dehalococcoidia bacterium]
MSPRRSAAGRPLALAALLAGAAVTITPFVMMVSISFTRQSFVLELPPRLLPKDPTPNNYVDAWTSGGFALYFLNSAAVAAATVAGVVLLSSMMAYAFARFDFPGKTVLFYALIAALMIPGMMLILPQFLLARDLGLIDSRLGLVLFYVGSQLAFITFLLRGFFQSVPRELEEAMRLDGAGAWRIYWLLMLPLSRPALATAGIFTFLLAWDEFAWALTIINDPDKRTLPLAIALFQGQHATSWGLVFAASVISVLPVIIIFVIFQRHFVSGLRAGALKG